MLVVKNWPIGVVVDQDQFRTPSDRHRKTRGENHRDAQSQALRPGLAATECRQRPVDLADPPSHLSGRVCRDKAGHRRGWAFFPNSLARKTHGNANYVHHASLCYSCASDSVLALPKETTVTKTFVRCCHLFIGQEDDARAGETLVFDEQGMLDYVGPEKAARRRARNAHMFDYSSYFVMPGLVDVHTHLAYGNAKSEEDIDLYSPLEFRTLRGMFFAQKVAAAGFPAICSPGDAGQISLSIRNAIRAGLFDGPRVMAAGPYLTTHQGLTDWYPTWIGAPETSIGKLVTTAAEAVEEIRRQVKNGVDCIKIALDVIQRRPDGELIAAFTQHETEVIVRETHRMGKKAIAHAVGREATLYAARAGVDLIFHGFDLDEECIAAMLEAGSFLCPTLTHPRNLIDFTQAHEPAAQKGRVEVTERRYRLGCANLRKAKAAGVPFLARAHTGFAVTPYGEWHARELEL